MASVRLQKFLAEAGVASRRNSEKLILEGRVSVNGKVVSILGTKVDPLSDEVCFDGEVVSAEQKKLYLFHKPIGIVTTLSDPQGRPCISKFTEDLPERVYPVGRLDSDVCGLLVLTNDGDYADKLLHPRNEVPRTYWALVDKKPTKSVLDNLVEGVELEWGVSKASSAKILEPSDKARDLFQDDCSSLNLIELTVAEGKKHFVKKLLKAVGHPVVRLARVSFGPFELGNIASGDLKQLSKWPDL